MEDILRMAGFRANIEREGEVGLAPVIEGP